jgi:hypothetical protein
MLGPGLIGVPAVNSPDVSFLQFQMHRSRASIGLETTDLVGTPSSTYSRVRVLDGVLEHHGSSLECRDNLVRL